MAVASKASGEGKYHLEDKRMILLKTKEDKNQFGGR